MAFRVSSSSSSLSSSFGRGSSTLSKCRAFLLHVHQKPKQQQHYWPLRRNLNDVRLSPVILQSRFLASLDCDSRTQHSKISRTNTNTNTNNNIHNKNNIRQFSTENTTKNNHQNQSPRMARVYIAVGSNLGHRFQNIDQAISLLCDSETQEDPKASIVNLLHTSMLHETAPMYVTDQPSFLNGAIEIETNLSPHQLLHRLKFVEEQMGRDLHGGIRNGPRPVDLDILFYFQQTTKNNKDDADDDDSNNNSNNKNNNNNEISLVMETPDLIIPHPRIQEREFVLAPLCEVSRVSGSWDLQHPILKTTVRELFRQLKSAKSIITQKQEEPERVVVLPLPRDRMIHLNKTCIMGVLNVTPDSFSDGGKWTSTLDLSVNKALEMQQEGADIIDIGGESTRPGAKEIAIEEELNRTIPVIQRIRQVSDIPISIDTRHSKVARAAIEAGADIVNDVSGGLFDPEMLKTVAELRVPIVLMHMKGTPETMQSYVDDYKNAVLDVSNALDERCRAAVAAGIPRWMQIVDPGIGFAKDLDGNLSLLKNLNVMRSRVGMQSTPILLGTSRKGFIGKVSGVEKPEDRDFGTVASCVAAICLEDSKMDSSNVANDSCNILRVHHVKAAKEAALVMDAIRQAV